METLLWQTRDGDVQEVTKLLKLSRKYKNYEVLFVDDICDSGKTIMQINQYFKEAMFSTLMDKVPEAGLVSYAPKTYSEHNLDWIIFPWEV